ncbi:MAG: PIN domain-containing protein [Ignavibacteriaceae bacterium]
MTLYIDTSVLGGYFEMEFELWSRKLIENTINGEYTAIISDITLAEIANAPKNVKDLADYIIKKNARFVTSNDESKEPAEKYIKEKIVSSKYIADALHIAIATINKVDVLTSWNFKHIVNLNRIRLYNSVNLKYGYNVIEIRSPRDMVEI